jgi:formyl-CoA transferase
MSLQAHHPRLGDSHAIGTPLKLSATPLDATRRAPMLGEHTDDVLAAAGYSQDEIEQLRFAGVAR